MPRITNLKKHDIDLQSVFSPGYLLDSQNRLKVGDEWLLHVPALINGSNTSFQMPSQIKQADTVLFLHFAVNGIQIPESKLSLNQAEPTIVEYDNSNYFDIEQTDLVEIWYVKAA